MNECHNVLDSNVKSGKVNAPQKSFLFVQSFPGDQYDLKSIEMH